MITFMTSINSETQLPFIVQEERALQSDSSPVETQAGTSPFTDYEEGEPSNYLERGPSNYLEGGPSATVNQATPLSPNLSPIPQEQDLVSQKNNLEDEVKS